VIHTLAVRSDGTVWAWGLNLDGEVANDTNQLHLTPQQVTGLPANITAVDGGKVSSLAQDSAGQVWAWGRVDRGPGLPPAPPVKIPGHRRLQRNCGRKRTLPGARAGARQV
jgi:alpha-tubulin suppressor-like RCC1 family protein